MSYIKVTEYEKQEPGVRIQKEKGFEICDMRSGIKEENKTSASKVPQSEIRN